MMEAKRLKNGNWLIPVRAEGNGVLGDAFQEVTANDPRAKEWDEWLDNVTNSETDWREVVANASDSDKKWFAKELLLWYDEVPTANHLWAEALVAAALDETGGDLRQAMVLAKQEYANDPTGEQ